RERIECIRIFVDGLKAAGLEKEAGWMFREIPDVDMELPKDLAAELRLMTYHFLSRATNPYEISQFVAVVDKVLGMLPEKEAEHLCEQVLFFAARSGAPELLKTVLTEMTRTDSARDPAVVAGRIRGYLGRVDDLEAQAVLYGFLAAMGERAPQADREAAADLIASNLLQVARSGDIRKGGEMLVSMEAKQASDLLEMRPAIFLETIHSAKTSEDFMRSASYFVEAFDPIGPEFAIPFAEKLFDAAGTWNSAKGWGLFTDCLNGLLLRLADDDVKSRHFLKTMLMQRPAGEHQAHVLIAFVPALTNGVLALDGHEDVVQFVDRQLRDCIVTTTNLEEFIWMRGALEGLGGELSDALLDHYSTLVIPRIDDDFTGASWVEELTGLGERLSSERAAESLVQVLDTFTEDSMLERPDLIREAMTLARRLPDAVQTRRLLASRLLISLARSRAARDKEDPLLLFFEDFCSTLSKDVLLEMLKWPFCIDHSQRIVLARLEDLTGGHFRSDLWTFIEQAESLDIPNFEAPIIIPSEEAALEELRKFIPSE
ncbi:MAG: hypothetical protein AAF492_17125, partial [Verrucomicrobiota bacterium]